MSKSKDSKGAGKMDIYEAWKQLKETVIELRDNEGTGSQKDICCFLINYMGILEKQIIES